MKRFYIVFVTSCLIVFSLSYFSVWYSFGGLALVMIYAGYRYYAVRIEGIESRNEILEQQLEQLQVHLDQSIRKEERTGKELFKLKKSKEGLLTVISHEVRTPMNGVIGMTTLLGETPLTNEQKEYIDTIRGCGESLLVTVNNLLANDILDSSKLNNETDRPENADFNLRDCVEEVLEMFAAKAVKSEVELICSIDTVVPATIHGDSKRIRQVLMNLVENAVKYTSRGEVIVNVRMNERAELSFVVKDNGIGIATEQLKKLFDGIPGKEGNAGLGLVVCRRLVESMNGHIEAESEQGIGSSFTFSVPFVKAINSKTTEIDLSSLENKKALILVANKTLRNELEKQMKIWKMVSTDSNPQVVITDNETIKAKYPSLPVVLLKKPARQHVLRDQLVAVFSNTMSNTLSEQFSKQYPLRILIAEDNIVNQKLAIKILSKLGYTPELATNGKEVMEMVGNDPYDMILMDVQMPEMDGLEATRMIRTCLDVQPVIIAMTANVMLGDRDACIQAGMNDYISKPIELDELMNQFEKWGKIIKEQQGKRNKAQAD